MSAFYIILPIFVIFTLWLGTLILDKAGFDKKWVLCLLIPVVNLFMIWVFAFTDWPNLKKDVSQGIN